MHQNDSYVQIRQTKGVEGSSLISMCGLSNTSWRGLQMYVKELTLWAHLSHVNILPFYGVYLHHETKRICLVSPWMENSNLHDYLQDRPETPRLLLVSEQVLDIRRVVIGNRSPISSMGWFICMKGQLFTVT